MTSKIRAVFFDAGNTLIYPRLEVLVEDLAVQGYPATVEDFFAAERAGKAKLDDWLWPQIRKGELPPTIDQYYWGECLAALMGRLRVPQEERGRLMLRVADGFRQITLWSRVMPDTPPYLEALRGRGYFMGVISNSIGTMEEQLGRVDLARYFDTVLDSAIVGVEKPTLGFFNWHSSGREWHQPRPSSLATPMPRIWAAPSSAACMVCSSIASARIRILKLPASPRCRSWSRFWKNFPGQLTSSAGL